MMLEGAIEVRSREEGPGAMAEYDKTEGAWREREEMTPHLRREAKQHRQDRSRGYRTTVL